MKHPPIVNRARALRQTESVAEKLLWERLRGHRLNSWGFRRQSPVGEFVVDFVCHAPSVIVEVDGPTHDNEEQKIFDAARTQKLEALGFTVIRVKERVVRDGLDHVVKWIGGIGAALLAGRAIASADRILDRIPHP